MSSPPSEEDLSSLIERLECIKREIPKDLSARKTLYDVARSLALALEAPGDSVLRIAYSVSLSWRGVFASAFILTKFVVPEVP